LKKIVHFIIKNKDLSRLKPFWALSRTPHGLLDMTTPAFAALVCLGHFPSFRQALLGIITAFAGYTAVYALNDLVDYPCDQERLKQDVFAQRNAALDIDAALVRHPLAQGLISFREGLLWTLFWAVIAVSGAWMLNPVCILFFIAGCLLESLYCLLFRVSPLRTLVNGVVKTLGPLAAVYALKPDPSLLYLLTLFFMLFFWEIGGQNIPNDCGDMEEDIRLKARTFPLVFGTDLSAFAVLSTLSGAFILSLILLHLSPADFTFPFYLILAAGGVILLIFPAQRFYQNRENSEAMMLFNKASYFPPLIFLLVWARIIFPAG
jgi:4-hydroxybenzoate polyprenyltransferase